MVPAMRLLRPILAPRTPARRARRRLGAAACPARSAGPALARNQAALHGLGRRAPAGRAGALHPRLCRRRGVSPAGIGGAHRRRRAAVRHPDRRRLAVVGSTAGAIALFLAARHHLAEPWPPAAADFFDRIRPGLQRDGFSYLLALRLVPAFPFWLVNLAAALCGMRLLPYAAATLLGIIPATFVFASIGAGVGDVLAAGGRPDLAVIFSPRIWGRCSASPPCRCCRSSGGAGSDPDA